MKKIIIGTVVIIGLFIIVKQINFFPVDHGPQDKGNLGILRSAISIYYSDTGGQFPAHLDVLVPQHAHSIPLLMNIKQHANSNGVIVREDLIPQDSGGWLYNKKTGEVIIDCTHNDGKGKWSDN